MQGLQLLVLPLQRLGWAAAAAEVPPKKGQAAVLLLLLGKGLMVSVWQGQQDGKSILVQQQQLVVV